MGSQRHEKLNWLQHNLPAGLLVDAAWLERNGYSTALRSKYVAHGWLDSVARGVYQRPTAKLPNQAEQERLGWQNVVISLQTLLGHALHVGGRTALELEGFAHYLALAGPRGIHLYGVKAPPGWLSRLELDTPFVFHNAGKLFVESGLHSTWQNRTPPAESHTDTGAPRTTLKQQTWGQWEWPLVISTPERAILELLDEVPRRETFHQADALMEGLRNLSPRRLQMLLAACRSVKVKRLFLWFAERHNHAWLKGLDRKRIDLGSGKRLLVLGGKLDTKFNITVPETLDAGG